MTILTMIDSAHLCADHGLHVIPVWKTKAGTCSCPRGAECISPGKHPTIDSWQTSATTDPTIIRDWFAGARNNIGIVCGPSKIVVIDVDPRNGGDETLATLTSELGPLPDTVAADSGGGGHHYVFRRPEGDLVSKLGAGGVDLLHDSRQFLVEPSQHHTGGTYRWKPGCAPDEASIATLPEPWLRKVRRVPAPRTRPTTAVPDDSRTKRAIAYVQRIPGAVSGDAGHTRTFNAVCHVMFGFDIDETATLNVIADHYNPRCEPPWSERELEHKVKSAAKQCHRERGYLLGDRPRVYSTHQAAAAAPAASEAASPSWQSLLVTKKDNTPRRGFENVRVWVKHHPDYAGKWALDLMTQQPWFDGQPMTEAFVHEIRAKIDQRLGFSPAGADVSDAILLAAQDRPFHPIRQYLRSVDWDGVERLSSMARDYLGSTLRIHADMVRKFMIGAATRALNPGCKLDTALMLIGNQGIGKSTFFKILGGAWHVDSTIDINNKDSFIQLHASWLYELAELENVVTGKQESRLKAWMASSHDTFRAPFARTAVARPRGCVLCGTTNKGQFLTDETGSRRFWIVPVRQRIDRELLDANRDQLWAEAVCAAESGEPWWLDETVDTEREEANDEHVEIDPWTAPVAEWLDFTIKPMVSVGEIATEALKIDIGKVDRWTQIRIGKIVARVGGWQKRRASSRGRPWFYARDVAA